MRVLLIAAVLGCGSTATSPPPLANRALAGAPAAEPTPKRAVDPACPLDWDALDANAPMRIPLATGRAADRDDCPPGFDPGALLAACPAGDCTTLRSGARAAFEMTGPDGTGRFAQLAVAVSGSRFACVTASSVGWRHLYRVDTMLAPLPWFADLDGDGTRELVAWHRVPWGGSEYDNGMVPVVYAITDRELVRRASSPLDARVAAAYRKLAAIADAKSDPVACYRALANALDPPHR